MQLPFCGLGYNGNPVPLSGVEVDAKVVEFTAEVVVTQYYFNNQSISLETDYVFPLDEKAAVCGFECIVNGRTITGVVKEKEEAKQEYRTAIAQNKTASLLEQHASDVFQIRIGNIPAYASVVIKLTYVTELDNEDDSIIFVVPTKVAPRYTPWSELYKSIPSTSTSMTNRAALSLSLQSVMKSQILAMECPTHVCAFGSTSGGLDGKATINLNAALSNDIVIRIQTADLGKPRLVLEQQTRATDDGAAAMITFIPRFTLDEIKSEFCFVLDCSGSMGGQRIESAKNALQLFLRCLPVDSTFNIVKFGSTYTSLFPSYQSYNEHTLQQATAWVSRVGADMGGTELLQAMQSAYTMPGTFGRMKQVFVLTDGEVSNTEQILQLVRTYNKTSRTFTLGIGGSVSHALVEGIARAGNGTCQYVVDGEGVQVKLMKQLKSALQPALTDIKVEWVTPHFTVQTNTNNAVLQPLMFGSAVPVTSAPTNNGSLIGHRVVFGAQPTVTQPAFAVPPVTNEPVRQAPFEFPPLFSGRRVLIYALFSQGMPLPQSVKVTAQSPDGPLSIELPLDQFKYSGNQIHTLAARSLIRDLEEGSSYLHKIKNQVFSLDSIVKNTIISLGKKYQLTSKHTSYIAVDHSSQVFSPPTYFYTTMTPVVPVSTVTTTTTSFAFAPSPAPSANPFNSNPTFGFGAQPAPVQPVMWGSISQQQSQPQSTRSFGSAPANNLFGSTTASSTSGFSFGGASTPNTFGSSTPVAPPPSSARTPSFSFGSSSATSGFGSTPKPSPASSFSFGASAPSAPTSTFSAQSTPPFSFATNSAPQPSTQVNMMDMDFLSAPISPSAQHATPTSLDLFDISAPATGSADPFASSVNQSIVSHSSSDKLMALISLQNFNGAFSESDRLLSLLSLNSQQVKSFAQTFQSALQLSSAPEAAVLITAIVVAFIESQFPARQDEWGLCINKSRQFIKSKIASVSIDVVIAKAKAIFGN